MSAQPPPEGADAICLQTPLGPVFVRVDPGATGATLPPVLLLHALGTDMSIWDRLATQLQASRTVIRIDAPGHGRTPVWPSDAVNLHTMAQSVNAVLNQLVPAAPVDMIGTSMGAVMALQAASLAPERVRRLIVCGALLVRSSEAAADMRQRSSAIQESGMGALTETMLARWFPRRPDGDDTEAVAQLRALMLRTPPAAYAMCSDALAGYDLTEALRARQSTTLLISGQQDGAIPLQLSELHALCPQARHLCLADTGHFPHLQRPDVFARVAEDFLSSDACRIPVTAVK